MARPRVKVRQRTAHACECCKRRKQKCDGAYPCSKCKEREVECAYSLNGEVLDHTPNDESQAVPRKRGIEDAHQGERASFSLGTADQGAPTSKRRATEPVVRPKSETSATPSVSHQSEDGSPTMTRMHSLGVLTAGAGSPGDMSVATGPCILSAAAGEDDRPMWTQPRVLAPPCGGLMYLGDSAFLSYLDVVRCTVALVDGESRFTQDPERWKIFECRKEAQIQAREDIPGRGVAKVLIHYYFTYTRGFVEIFDEYKFFDDMNLFYSRPEELGDGRVAFEAKLCLAMAVGLVMASPATDSVEEAAIKPLLDEVHAAESLCSRAEVAQSEDSEHNCEIPTVSTVQIYILMALYKLLVSRRNVAFVNLGTAMRCSQAMGLDQVVAIKNSMTSLSAAELRERCNVWRSLFVLDQFVSASLGRNPIFHMEACTSESLENPAISFPFEPQSRRQKSEFAPRAANFVDEASQITWLDVSVHSGRTINRLLFNVYWRKQISNRSATLGLEEARDWRRTMVQNGCFARPSSDLSQSAANLHVNLLHYHAVILLSRPYFMHLFRQITSNLPLHDDVEASKRDPTAPPKMAPRITRPRPSDATERLAEACVVAANQSLYLINENYRAGYLAKSNPFVLYFLFASSLVILSSEFASMYRNRWYDRNIANSREILGYCSDRDPQARRLLYIVAEFANVIARRKISNATPVVDDVPELHGYSDPLAKLFADATGIENQATVRMPALRTTGSPVTASGSPPLPQPPIPTRHRGADFRVGQGGESVNQSPDQASAQASRIGSDAARDGSEAGVQFDGLKARQMEASRSFYRNEDGRALHVPDGPGSPQTAGERPGPMTLPRIRASASDEGALICHPQGLPSPPILAQRLASGLPVPPRPPAMPPPAVPAYKPSTSLAGAYFAGSLAPRSWSLGGQSEFGHHRQSLPSLGKVTGAGMVGSSAVRTG